MKLWTTGIIVTLAAAAGCQGPAGPAGPAGSRGNGTAPTAVSVSAGSEDACAVLSDGTVWCWGVNHGDQLGNGFDGGPAAWSQPVAIPLGGQAKAVAAGDGFTCALLVDGSVWCWGGSPGVPGGNGKLTKSPSRVPFPPGTTSGDGGAAPAPSPRSATAIAVSHGGSVPNTPEYACALMNDQTMWCWGFLDQSAGAPLEQPTQMENLVEPTAIAVGKDYVCALEGKHNYACWGVVVVSDQTGPSPQPLTSSTAVPVQMNGAVLASLYATPSSPIAAGDEAACALMADSTIDCWGLNKDLLNGGQHGNGADSVPVSVPDIDNAIAVAVGLDSACAIISGGRVACWGNGPLGDGLAQLGYSATRVWVSDLPNVTSIAVGDLLACAVSDGTAWCWGAGALGNGNDNGSAVPVPVVGLGSTGDAGTAEGDAASNEDALADDDAGDFGDDASDGGPGDATVAGDGGREGGGSDAAGDSSATDADAGLQCQDAGETPGAHGEPVTVSAGASCVLPAAITSNTDLSPAQCAVYGAPNGVIVGSPTGPPPTLTIEAGTTIAFGPGTNLIVGAETASWPTSGPGAVQVNGTPCQPVVFTASGTPTPGGWGGVTFQQATATSTVKNLVVQYGGGGGQYIVSNGLGSVGSFRLDGYGVSGSPADFTVVLEGVTVSNNAAGGFEFVGPHTGPGPGSGTLTVTDWPPGYVFDPYLIDPDAVGLLANTSLSTTQAGAYVHVASPYTHGSEDIDSSETWPSIRFPYVLGLSSEPTNPGDNTLEVVAGATSDTIWTIAAPNTLQFDNGFRIDIRTPGGAGPSGAIQANGAPGSPIVFEGIGGVPQPSTWQGIDFPDGVYFTPSSITYATIDSAGAVAGFSIDPLSALYAGYVCDTCSCVTGPAIANVTFTNLPTTSYAICATGASQPTAQGYAADNTFPSSANAVYTLAPLDAGAWVCGE
jgi:alpha-tubulin suppressor-like RCC1 family protein